MSDEMNLKFLGGAGTVTGSKHLVEFNGRRLLLDCGLFQGLKELRLRNWDRFPIDPSSIDAVVLSHAHIDHSGYLPLLVRNGFSGPIFCTEGTRDLLGVLLIDAAHLQEEEAERANHYGYSKHKPALPLYTNADAEAALKQIHHVPYGKPFQVLPDATAQFRRAAHILGASTVQLDLGKKNPCRLVFSGDLGRWNRPILRDPELVPEADVLLIESTYGNRLHPQDPEGALAQVVREAADRGGALIIPAFAVGRVQELMWTLRKLEDEKRIPSLPVFVDSPMAINVTDIYVRHPEDHDLDMKALMDQNRSPLACRHSRFVRTPIESKALNERSGPMIIISASGMATGGRVLHHLKMRLPDPRTTVLLPGFQAAGTRGRSLQEGASEIRIHGENVPVRATVKTLDGLSAHADQSELLRWARGFRRPPRLVFAVHGEQEAARALSELLARELGWAARPAVPGERVELR